MERQRKRSTRILRFTLADAGAVIASSSTRRTSTEHLVDAGRRVRQLARNLRRLFSKTDLRMWNGVNLVRSTLNSFDVVLKMKSRPGSLSTKYFCIIHILLTFAFV